MKKDYTRIINKVLNDENLSSREKKEIIESIRFERDEEYQADYNKETAKNIGGEALMLGSSVIPFGGAVAGLSATGLKLAQPLMKQIIVNSLKKATIEGALSGAIFGFGKSLQEDKTLSGLAQEMTNSITTGLLGGAAFGTLGGTIATKFGNNANRINKLQNKLNQRDTLKNLDNALQYKKGEIKNGRTRFNQRTNGEIKATDTSAHSSNQIGGGKININGQNSRTISGNNDKRNDGIRLFIRRNNLWVVDKTSKNKFNNKHISNSSYKELPQEIESGNSFYEAITNAKKDLGDLGASVHTYTPEEYSKMKLFLSEDGMSGVAVKSDGDIVSVFSKAGKFRQDKGRGHALVELAKQNGGKKLDAFDTYLPDFYKKHGFEETSRDVWNEQYKPEGWNKEFYSKYNNGEPDVVYMELKNADLETENLNTHMGRNKASQLNKALVVSTLSILSKINSETPDKTEAQEKMKNAIHNISEKLKIPPKTLMDNMLNTIKNHIPQKQNYEFIPESAQTESEQKESMRGGNGHWVTINGNHVFIEGK